MRSSTFIILSLIIHVLIVAAVALSPSHTIEPLGSEVEVSMGEPAETPGVEEATEVTHEAPATSPEPKLEPVEPVAVKPPPVAQKPIQRPVKKAAAQKPAAAPKAAPVAAAVVEESSEPAEVAELPAKEEVAAAPAEELTPDIQNIDEVEKAEAAAEAAPAVAAAPVAKTQEESPDAKTEATSPEANAPGPEQEAGGDLGKGGATQAAAVSYTDLKQAKGNANPQYPLKARKEGRQGQVELVYRVTKDGRVADVQVAKSSGHADLDSAAVRAISKFKFVASQEGWAYHPVNFTLKGDSAPLPSRLRTAGSGE